MAGVTAAVVAGVGAAVAIGGGIAGAKMAEDAQKDAARAQMDLGHQAEQNYKDIPIPTVSEQMIQLERIKSAGNLTPEQETAVNLAESELQKVQADPTDRQAQLNALASLQKLGETGMTDMDRAALNQVMNSVNNQEKANREALLQNYRARGMAGSGTELAATLAGNQAATQSAADQGFNVAAQAQQRALQAIQAGGQLGGQMENQAFSEDVAKAQAQDAINKFNAQNQQEVLGRNVQRANYANERNLTNQQQINEANTNLANQQEVYNKGLQQTRFGNELQIAQGKNAGLLQQANAAALEGKAGADFGAGISSMTGKVGGSLMSYGLGDIGPGGKKKAE